MLGRLLDYVRLPREISDFERGYLARTNRVALVFFALHVPVFALIAWMNGTNPALAVLLTSLAVAGPLLASFALPNPRHTSVVFGVAAMYVGALLVHFGRGLWTIEMHFYFFALIAMLAIFGNPMVVLAAALTVTLHHAVLWYFLPESVFNYDAPITSVAVHATFVVIETTAACYVARTFFDSVIALERTVAQRTRERADLLDSVRQGLLTAGPDGVLAAHHSRALAEWFGAPQAGERIWEYFARTSPLFGDWLQLGWEALSDGGLPPEFALAQLPRRFEAQGKVFEVAYQPIAGGHLVVVTDASERVARERTEAVQRETMAVFEHLVRDRFGFLEFFDESSERVAELSAEPCRLDDATVARAIHTLKGNGALFGVQSLVDTCNEIESRCSESRTPPNAGDRRRIGEVWAEASARVQTFLGENRRAVIQVDEAEFVDALAVIAKDAPRDEVVTRLARWRKEPTSQRLTRFADLALALAERLGVAPIEVEVDDNAVRLDRDALTPFWASMVHVVRNAVDHGLGTVASDHPRRLVLATSLESGRVKVSIGDNGSGIDWVAVRARAAEMGLPHDSDGELVDALFRDGMSTRRQATSVSGRGVGLAAVRQACAEIGAEIVVASHPGTGTRFEFLLPQRLAA